MAFPCEFHIRYLDEVNSLPAVDRREIKRTARRIEDINNLYRREYINTLYFHRDLYHLRNKNDSPRVSLYFEAGKRVIDLASMAQPLRVKSEILNKTCTKHMSHIRCYVRPALLLINAPTLYGLHQHRH